MPALETNDQLAKFPSPLEAFQLAKKVEVATSLTKLNGGTLPDDPSPTSIDYPSERLELIFSQNVTTSQGITLLALQKILTAEFLSPEKPFQHSTVRLMFSLFHKGSSQSLEFREFVKLWNYLKQWHEIFMEADTNRSNSIEYKEYLGALREVFGEDDFNSYILSNLTVATLNFKTFCDTQRSMSFDRFTESVVWLIRVVTMFVGGMDDGDLRSFLECAIGLRY
ncbi:hypothetical protein DASC09_014740 [Saccharomycopsis crataegensis]|uniref:EF-hand domain-containing protein n=1 Tax=Saccharomycopsis crataegensis TaxID=43959 RepID=A0AAV5QHD8_9ASCO|nr:hypothetical protein DASC09_014740 [Saccharomycopsis crataegensis]